MTKLDRAIAALQEAISAYEDLPTSLQERSDLGNILRDQVVFLSDLRDAVQEMKGR
jgi:hypothetical protein